MRNRLTELLAIHNKTGKELAQVLGTDKNHITDMKKNQRKTISYEHLDKICDFFQISPGEFFKK